MQMPESTSYGSPKDYYSALVEYFELMQFDRASALVMASNHTFEPSFADNPAENDMLTLARTWVGTSLSPAVIEALISQDD